VARHLVYNQNTFIMTWRMLLLDEYTARFLCIIVCSWSSKMAVCWRHCGLQATSASSLQWIFNLYGHTCTPEVTTLWRYTNTFISIIIIIILFQWQYDTVPLIIGKCIKRVNKATVGWVGLSASFHSTLIASKCTEFPDVVTTWQ